MWKLVWLLADRLGFLIIAENYTDKLAKLLIELDKIYLCKGAKKYHLFSDGKNCFYHNSVIYFL